MASLHRSSGRSLPVKFVTWCLFVSSAVSAFGIAFLVAFFNGLGGQFGTLNDIAVVIQYIIMLPVAVILRQYLHTYDSSLSFRSFVVGVSGMLIVIVLQVLLLTDLIPFGPYIFIVSAGFLIATVWFVLTGIIGRKARDDYPNGMMLDLLAGLYVGYPVWAFRLGKWASAQSKSTVKDDH